MAQTPDLEAALQVRSHKGRAEQNHLPWPAGLSAFGAAQDMIGFLWCQHILAGHVQYFIHWHFQVLLRRAALHPLSPHSITDMPMEVQQLALDLLSLMRFTLTHSSGLSSSLWMHPGPQVCQLPHPAWCHLQTWWGCTWSPCQSLMKTLSSTGHNTLSGTGGLCTSLYNEMQPCHFRHQSEQTPSEVRFMLHHRILFCQISLFPPFFFPCCQDLHASSSGHVIVLINFPHAYCCLSYKSALSNQLSQAT